MASPLLYRTIREQIVEQLRTEVLSGKIAEGESIREQKLADRFGVSRGPIRDALLQLTQEGLLVSQPNRGVRVGQAPSPTIQPLVIELRRRIESFALRQIFSKLTSEDIQEMEAILKDFHSASQQGEMAAVVEHDMAFHRWIVNRVGDPDLSAIWLSNIVRMRLRYTRHDSLNESYREHQAVLDAIRNGDEEAAVQALEANIQ